MISSEDCCILSEDKTQLDHTTDEVLQAEQQQKCSTNIVGIAYVENTTNDEATQPTLSTKKKVDKTHRKFRRVSGLHFNYGKKRKYNSKSPTGFRPKELMKLPMKNLINYICSLENTLKRQQNTIRYLQMKLKKLEFVNVTKHSHTDCEMHCVTADSSSVNAIIESENRTLNSDINNSANVRDGNIDLLNQESGKKKNDSIQNEFSKYLDAKNNTAIHSTYKRSEEQSNNCENSRILSNQEQCLSSEEASITITEVQNIQSDSEVHLYTNEMNMKNGFINDCEDGVKNSVEEYILREDVSVTDLNVKSEEGDRVKRFRRHFLIVLYKQFLAEVGSECSFLQFCKFIPSNVIKPSPTYWKNLMCPRCENTELKFMEIVSKILMRKNMSLEEVLAKQDLFEYVSLELRKLKDSPIPFTYRSWARTLLGKMEASERIVTTTIGSACTDILKQLDLLKEHMIRCYNQYEAVKEAREETEMSSIHAMVHIDWYESPATFVARLLHTSYYCGNGFKSLHAGFVRTQKKSYGFASLSDCRDHTAPAVWASISDILVSLAREGMKVITIVSDSATAQYRNKGNFYLMRRFAKQNNVEMKWIYLEGGHGKGIADAVGASVKQVMCDTIAKYPNKSFRNTVDILPFIKDLTDVKVFSHSEQLVQQYKNLLSRQHLQVVPSTYKIHEVCVKETTFYVKESSADKLPFFSLDLDTQVKGN